jgi:hypothetical protein
MDVKEAEELPRGQVVIGGNQKDEEAMHARPHHR